MPIRKGNKDILCHGTTKQTFCSGITNGALLFHQLEELGRLSVHKTALICVLPLLTALASEQLSSGASNETP